MLDGYEKFKKDVYALTSIDLNCYKEKQMKRRIDTLITKNKIDSYNAYVEFIKKDKSKFEQFVNFLTINVSEFYRNPEQWGFLDKEVFPQLVQRFGKNLKIWSAACSTGDEPYSLVMALSKHVPLNQIKIIATDIDKQVLDKARMVSTMKRLQSVPEEFKKKYFKQIGTSYQISDEIKKRVEFKEHNLLKDPYPSGCHLIVCRNVVIYFTEEAKDEIYKKFNQALSDRWHAFYRKHGTDHELQGFELQAESVFLFSENLKKRMKQEEALHLHRMQCLFSYGCDVSYARKWDSR